MVQIDVCDHEWFEDRAPQCALLVYVDDATGELMELRFVESESAFDYFAATRVYLARHGRPAAFHSDKHSIFRVARTDSSGRSNGVTQFGRAQAELNIDIICANTPQAKGRVERMNQTLQDRLVKELRLQSISSMAEANAFAPAFMADYNRRFGRPARDPHDGVGVSQASSSSPKWTDASRCAASTEAQLTDAAARERRRVRQLAVAIRGALLKHWVKWLLGWGAPSTVPWYLRSLRTISRKRGARTIEASLGLPEGARGTADDRLATAHHENMGMPGAVTPSREASAGMRARPSAFCPTSTHSTTSLPPVEPPHSGGWRRPSR